MWDFSADHSEYGKDFDRAQHVPGCQGRWVLRRRNADAHPFYGCTLYPQCCATVDAHLLCSLPENDRPVEA